MFFLCAQIVPNVHVRITDLPIDDLLRNLRQSDVNSLVKVSGVVTRRTGVFCWSMASSG